MYLIYTDESGTNGNISSRYSLYGGLVVHETAVLKFEMQIIEIVQEFIGVSNMLEAEIHFTEIFNYILYKRIPSKKNKVKKFNDEILPIIHNKTEDDIIKFIDELLQLTHKANITFLYSYIDKQDSFHNSHYLQNKEISYNAYTFKGFINLLDNFLTKHKEMGLLIADSFENQLPQEVRNLSLAMQLSDDTIKKFPYAKELIYKRVLAESLIWKNKFMNGSISSNKIAPLQYKFESNSFNIIDNISFISSKDSIINQVADIILFVLRKNMEYEKEPQKYTDIKSLFSNNNLKSTLEFVIGRSILYVHVQETSNGNIDVFYPMHIIN